MKRYFFAIGITLVAFFGLYSVVRSWVVDANRQDCGEAGRRMHGTPTLVVMPDGVRDVCLVKTEDAGTIPVQLR